MGDAELKQRCEGAGHIAQKSTEFLRAKIPLVLLPELDNVVEIRVEVLHHHHQRPSLARLLVALQDIGVLYLAGRGVMIESGERRYLLV